MDDGGFQQVLKRIEARAADYDQTGQWPADDLADLAAIGAMRWAVSREYGGDDVPALDLHDRYEQIAAASLATALVLSQRDAAVGFIEASDNANLKADLLPRLVSNEAWSTIGISHLTTSSKSGTLIARNHADGYIVHGTIPWATGGVRSKFIVAGAKSEDGKQLVFVLRTDSHGVCVQPPIRLSSLAAAQTSAVDCAGVKIDRSLIVAGPAEQALAKRRNSLPIGQVFAALGLTRAALELIRKIDHPSAHATRDSLQKQFDEMSSAARNANTSLDTRHDLQRGPLLRSECNNLALRAIHAAVTLHKGASLRLDHPAQRLAREGLFLLVWSTPASVSDRNLELFSETH